MNYPVIKNRINRARVLASRVFKAMTYKNYRDDLQFSRKFSMPEVSDKIRQMTEADSKKFPVVFLHGVAPRSGTNYLNALLDKHPAFDSCPGDIYEFPFLTHIDEFVHYKDLVMNDYPRNHENIIEGDLLCGFGLSLIYYLYQRANDGKIPLVKEPSVRNLRYFHHMFPGHRLLMLIRDGRDVVQSTVSSWPGWTIKEAADRWAKSARVMLEYNEHYAGNGNCLLVYYEALVENLSEEMNRVCNYLEIDGSIYTDDIENTIPVIGSSTHSKKGGRVSWKAVDKSKDFKHKNKWAAWSKKQKDSFKKVAGDALIQSGYEENNNW